MLNGSENKVKGTFKSLEAPRVKFSEMLAKEQQDKETELLTPVGTRELVNEGGRGWFILSRARKRVLTHKSCPCCVKILLTRHNISKV